ncbi:MAG: helix-turn-helix domain-containing protein [Planctomycetota bacterium]
MATNFCSQARPPRIGVMIEASGGWPRSVLLGLLGYARPGRQWLFKHAGERLHDLESLRDWQPDAIVARIADPALAEGLAAWTGRVINISNMLPDQGFAHIGPDDSAVGQLAAEHLLDRGYRAVVVVADPRQGFCRERSIGFVAQCVRRDLRPQSVEVRETAIARDSRALDAHLVRLPPDTALFATTDAIALACADSAQRVGRLVPEELAVLSAGDHELHCRMSLPALSCVRFPGEAAGFTAGEWLAGLFDGSALPQRPLRLAPVEVIARRSTDAMIIPDRTVVAALEYIHRAAAGPLGVAAVLAQVGVSRRTLEQKFRQWLGRTPLQEIHRTRIARAKALMMHSPLPLARIAQAAGFRDPQHFARQFRRHTGTTPRAFRRPFV